jgi:hypothetical protein
MRMARISYWVPGLVLLPLLTGCSDPVPPASQGAVSLNLASPDAPSTARCNVGGAMNAPVMAAGIMATTTVSKGTIALDGENGNKVSCTVAPGGSGYNVGATIHSESGANFTDISISDLVIAEGQSDVAGRLSALSQRTQNAYSSPTTAPCKFSVTGASLGIGPGKIWGSVTCPGLKDPGNAGGDECKATGNFIFENCAQ